MKANCFLRLSTSLIIITFSILGCQNDTDPTNGKAIVTTSSVSNITYNSALSGGNISQDGGSPIISRGIVWGITSNPTISLSTKTLNGIGVGGYVSLMDGLTPGTAYFVRAYATNSIGTVYGDESKFITPAQTLASLTTNIVATITGTTYLSGGNITSDGGSPISSRGVCWGISSNPTTALSSKTSDGIGAGSYQSSVTGLTEGTRYYLRAFATNEVGTSYGNEVKFQAVEPFIDLDNAIAKKMIQYGIPGLSLAIVRNEKLVYARSYGYADVEAKQIASNDDLYRIASVSKPITVIAILKLVQHGLLSLDQKVFGDNSILGNKYGVKPYRAGYESITVKHILDHKSGLPTNDTNDPMFMDIKLTQDEIIDYTVRNRDLLSVPGVNYFYSNFGYCVLGRVIEKITGLTYEDYVKLNVLQPSGISEMKISGNNLNDRLSNEVKYYQNDISPYIFNIKRMDSHGGWIASSTDLARFMVRIDRNPLIADIVPVNLLNQFYFANNWSHTGGLPGTSSIIMRLNNTYSYALITNTRSDMGLVDLNNVVSDQIYSRSTWPTYDLF